MKSKLPKHALVSVGWNEKEQGETEQERNARMNAISSTDASVWANRVIDGICRKISSGKITPDDEDIFIHSSQSKEFNSTFLQLN